MPGIKGLVARVHRLEPKPSRILLKLGGSIERFQASIQQGIEEGRYDPLDMPIVVHCLKKWVSDGLG